VQARLAPRRHGPAGRRGVRPAVLRGGECTRRPSRSARAAWRVARPARVSRAASGAGVPAPGARIDGVAPDPELEQRYLREWARRTRAPRPPGRAGVTAAASSAAPRGWCSCRHGCSTRPTGCGLRERLVVDQHETGSRPAAIALGMNRLFQPDRALPHLPTSNATQAPGLRTRRSSRTRASSRPASGRVGAGS